MSVAEAKKIANRLAMLSKRGWEEERIALFANDLFHSTIGVLPFDVVQNTLSRMLEEVDPDDVTLAKLSEYVKTKAVLPKRRYLPPPEDESGPAEKPIYFPERDNGKEPFPVAYPDEAERERMRAQYARAMLPATVIHRRDLGITAKHVADAEAWRTKEIAKIEGELAELEKGGQLADMNRQERDIVIAARRQLERLRYAQKPDPNRMTPFGDLLLNQLSKLGKAMKLHCTQCGMELNSAEIDGYTRACMNAGKQSLPEPPRWCARCTPVSLKTVDEDADVPF
jgi:hypothetical protein